MSHSVSAPVNDSVLDALAARLALLEDREEIRQRMYSYARGTDRLDRALVEDAYHPDAHDDHGTFSGDRATAVDVIVGNPSGAPVSMHHLGNMLIELDGDTAHVETYFFACQANEVDGRPVTRIRAGRYLDRFERRDGGWRIAHRVVVDDWSRLDEVTSLAPGLAGRVHPGRRDRDDRSYELSAFTPA